jgi:hypothetical protein
MWPAPLPLIGKEAAEFAHLLLVVLRCVRPRTHGIMQQPRRLISRPAWGRKSELLRHDAALRRANVVFADEVRQLDQQFPKPGILFKQGVNLVGMIVTTKSRLVSLKGSFE